MESICLVCIMCCLCTGFLFAQWFVLEFPHDFYFEHISVLMELSMSWLPEALMDQQLA